MNCPSCHKEIRDGDIFCRICGAKIVGETPAFENLTRSDEPVTTTELLQEQVRLTKEVTLSLKQLLKLQQRADERLEDLKPLTDEILDIETEPTDVNVADINMSFWSMVRFMVTWAIASIPAFIIIILTVFLLYAVFGSLIILLIHALM
jgi:hypothetical protein